MYPGLLCLSSLLPRLGQTLSVRGEDIGEDMFCEALGRAVEQWPGAKLLDHVCVESSILGKLLHRLPPILELTASQPIPTLLGDLEKGGKTQPPLLLLKQSFPIPNSHPACCSHSFFLS